MKHHIYYIFMRHQPTDPHYLYMNYYLYMNAIDGENVGQFRLSYSLDQLIPQKCYGYWLICSRSFKLSFEDRSRISGKRVRKTISSAWLSLISTLTTGWWKILNERYPLFSFTAVSVASLLYCGRNNILSSRRRRKSESRPGRQAEEKTERRATQNGKTSLPRSFHSAVA